MDTPQDKRLCSYIPTCEDGVVCLFGRYYDLLGFSELVEVRKTFPDCIAIKDGKAVRIEFEYRASNFKTHKHNPNEADLIVCWVDDTKDGRSTAELPVLELSSALVAQYGPEAAVKVELDLHEPVPELPDSASYDLRVFDVLQSGGKKFRSLNVLTALGRFGLLTSIQIRFGLGCSLPVVHSTMDILVKQGLVQKQEMFVEGVGDTFRYFLNSRLPSGVSTEMLAELSAKLKQTLDAAESETKKETAAELKGQGVRLGRKPKTRHFTPELMLSMIDNGMSIRKAAEALGCSRSVVHNTVKMLRPRRLKAADKD